MDRISIGQAATEFGVSRRTLERWVRSGQLRAVPNPEDGRQRLVDPAAVRQLIGQMQRRRRRRASSQTPDQISQTDTSISSSDIPYHCATDKALLQVDAMRRRLYSQLVNGDAPDLSLEELRGGPLGQELERLVAYVEGQTHGDDRRIRVAVETVLQVLFWPTATSDYTVPRAFWGTDLGRLLSRAKLQTFHPHELVLIEDAAPVLGVTKPTLYRWLDDRTLDYAVDDHTGRIWIVRQSLEQLRRAAMTMKVQPLPADRALAS